MRSFVLLLAAALALPFAGGAGAQSPAAEARDLRPTAGRAIEGFVRPTYGALAEAARAHAADWAGFCGERRRDGLERVTGSYHRLADAWGRIEFLRYGPIGEDFRAERLDFWPDKRNATTRGVAALIAPDAAEPTVATIKSASAAVQGLPALERLLYDPGAAARLTGPGAEGARACAAGRAIAGGVAVMADEVAVGWGPIAEAAASDPALAREIAARLVTDLLTGFQTSIDAKLLPAMGKTAEAARPEAFQGRRAGRVREGFVRPLAGMEDLARQLVGTEAGATTLFATMATARSVAEGLPDGFAEGLGQPKTRMRAILLLDALRGAQDTALADLPPLVGVTVGFNSRDGD
jgi:predicted lipoprotein